MSAPYAERPFTIGNIVGESLSLYRRFFIRFFVLALIVFLIVDLIPAVAATVSPDSERALWFAIGVVASTIANALTTPFVALCWTLAYLHLRATPSSAPQRPAGAASVDP